MMSRVLRGTGRYAMWWETIFDSPSIKTVIVFYLAGIMSMGTIAAIIAGESGAQAAFAATPKLAAVGTLVLIAGMAVHFLLERNQRARPEDQHDTIALGERLGGARVDDEGWVQLATRIPRSLRLELKLYCATSGTLMQDFIVAAIEEKLARAGTGSARQGPGD